jgi:hypothetical protein
VSDRPLHRRAVKLAFACLGPSRAHWQETWPGLGLERAGAEREGAIVWHGQRLAPLAPLGALAERAGTTVCIVGSGPSMRGTDPGLLPGWRIALNGAASLDLGGAVAVEDERFVWRHLDMLRRHLAPEMPRLLSPAVIRVLAARAPNLLRAGPVVLMENLGKRAGERRRRELPLVSQRPEAGVVVAGTVAFSALQMALALPVAGVAFAGVDLGNAGAPRFYERAGDAAPSGLLAGLERILGHFAAAHELARARGVELWTVTPGSALERIGIPYRPV